MEIPLLHCQGHYEAADEKEDDVVEIDGGHLLAAHDARGGKQDHREESGHGQRDGLRNPPHSHPENDCDDPFPGAREIAAGGQHQDQEHERTDDPADDWNATDWATTADLDNSTQVALSAGSDIIPPILVAEFVIRDPQ